MLTTILFHLFSSVRLNLDTLSFGKSNASTNAVNNVKPLCYSIQTQKILTKLYRVYPIHIQAESKIYNKPPFKKAQLTLLGFTKTNQTITKSSKHEFKKSASI